MAAWNAARGIAAGETLAVATVDGGRFAATTRTAAIAARGIAETMTERDCWVSANPMRSDIPEGRKGTARDVTRLACLYADLDVKPGGMPTYDGARGVIDTLTGMLGVAPAAVVMTGHGLQPVWRVTQEPGRTDWPDANAPAFAQAQSLAQRFGRLVQAVAQRHGGAADTVSNLDRVLRAPGTTNRKGEPIRTTLQLHPDPRELTLDRLAEILDKYAVPTMDAPAVSPSPRDSDAPAATPYAELSADRQQEARRYLEGARGGILRDLDTLCATPHGEGAKGWDAGSHYAATCLLEIADTLCVRLG